MRGFTRLLAVAAIAVGVVSAPGTAVASEMSIQSPPPGCTGWHDGSTYAEATCSTYKLYRVSVTYCRVQCNTEYGIPADRDKPSRLELPAGGGISNLGVDIIEF
ncbi:hypothetical protein [Allokutzneria albata]|uniref:Secreted protein n=1 Tax=Allokutzneria albata TaxID=211114 RepID=A0A1G9VKS0_ALLAB|nr:hypothetical protein [Allokutzneria albata]SDM72425.1 hypothetical protein SAMN04489726_3080 [Allokutzneria albata]